MQVIDASTDNDEPILSHALLVYTRHGIDSVMDGQGMQPGDAICSIHRIVSGEVQVGKPIEEETYAGLVHAIGGGGRSQVRRILPPHVLFAAPGDRLLWYKPAGPNVIWFRTGNEAFNKEMNGRIVLYPNLLFLARRGSLCVWALKGSERPAPETPLYRAPFCNIYSSGEMCEGNTRLPDSLGEESISAWEAIFFGTEFTHSNYRGAPMTAHLGGHDGYWRSRAFPEDAALSGKPLSPLSRPHPNVDPADYLVPLMLATSGGARPRPLTVGVILNQ